MPRKRPTEATWDSDDDLLNDEVGINATYATKRVADEFNQDEVDEEALLAYSDDEIQVVAEDEIEQTEEVVEEVYVEDDEEEEVPDDGQVVQEEIYEERVPVTDVYHAEQTTHSEDVLESEQQPEHEDEESDSGSDGEGGRRRRARFQSERGSFEIRSTSTVSLSTTTKKEIPDKLPDISAEDQAKIDKYMTKGGGRGRGRGRGQGRQAWGARGGQQQQFRPRIGQPIQTHHAPIQHHQHIQHVEHQHYDYGQNVHHVQPPQQPHAHYYEHPQHAPPQHSQHVPQQHVQHVPQQHAQHVPQQHAQHVPQHHAQPVHYEPPVQHVVCEPPRPQQPIVGAPASQPNPTKKIHINPHFKPKVESPRPAWEPPRSQPAPQYAPPSQPQPAPQHYPPRSEPVHQPVYSQAWTSAGPVQHYAQPQYTVSQAPPPQPYQPPPPVQPAYQSPPPPAYPQSAPAPTMPPQRYQAPPQHVHHQVVHQHPGPPPGQEVHRYPGPPPPQHHYQAPPPPRHEPPRLAPPTSQGVMYHPQHVHVESSQPPVIHEQHQPGPQVTPVQARPQVAQVRPRQQVISRPAGRPPSRQYVQHGFQVQGSQTIQTVIGRKKPGYNQQQQFSAPQQNKPRQPFQGTNRQSVQVTIPRKRLPDVPNPAVAVLIAPKLAKIDGELPQNNIKIQTVDMRSEPVDEEYQRKLEEQKRLREEIKRNKEARRLMQSSQRKEQVQKTLAEQGIQVVEPAPVNVNQTVQVIERRPVVNNQKVNMRYQNQNVVTQVPIQENTGPKVVRTSGPTQTQKQPGPGRHLVSRKVYKLHTLKDGRQIRQLVSSGQPEEVSAPPPQQGGIVRVVRNQNVNPQRRFPGPPGPQQRMLGPRPGPRPGFRPDFHGPRLFKQFLSQGPPGPGPRFRGPGPMGMRFRGPGPHMMRFSGPHRPPMGMHQGPRKMMRGPAPRQAVPPTAKGAPKVQGQQTTPQAQGVRQDKTQVTGIKRTINTAESSKGPGEAATAPKRVVVDNSLVKKPIGDGVTKSVSIENLSSSTSLVGIRKLCTSIGPLENIKLDAKLKKATAKFQNPTHAAKFVKKYNRHMVDLSTINLTLLV